MRLPTQTIDLSAGPVEYRLERRGPDVVLMVHGGHMRAALALGEDVFAEAGCTILAPSRPGYGRTPLATGATPTAFADVIAELCGTLGIERLAAVVGQSGGGPTAVMLAARHPELVQRLVLQSAVGFLPWPDRRTRLGAAVVFRAGVERWAWAAIRSFLRAAPDAGLRLLLHDLTTGSSAALLADLPDEHRGLLLGLFSRMRSGSGFTADLRAMAEPPDPIPNVSQPALIIASPHDAAVPFAHAESLAAAIPRARLITSRAPSHFIWLGDDYPAIAAEILRFLGTKPPTAQPDRGP
jgi:pimeloyl-ACP methyl ester carboxylesterase